jgi:hypothetical protein
MRYLVRIAHLLLLINESNPCFHSSLVIPNRPVVLRPSHPAALSDLGLDAVVEASQRRWTNAVVEARNRGSTRIRSASATAAAAAATTIPFAYSAATTYVTEFTSPTTHPYIPPFT